MTSAASIRSSLHMSANFFSFLIDLLRYSSQVYCPTSDVGKFRDLPRHVIFHLAFFFLRAVVIKTAHSFDLLYASLYLFELSGH